MFIDTHTHLFVEEFDADRDQVVSRAIKNGIGKLLLPNIDISTITRLREMIKSYPETCFGMMGLHPGSVKEDWREQLALIREELNSGNYLAIGEIGMDLYWDRTFLDEQRVVFREQLRWAKELHLPVAIHAREAFDEIFSIVDEENSADLKGVFHCFTGTVEQAKHIISYGGFKLGIGGVLTYKKAALDEVLKKVDLKHLVLETDSPYLSPVPFRGKRNESSYLVHIAEKLSDIYGLKLSEIEIITTANTCELFGIPE